MSNATKITPVGGGGRRNIPPPPRRGSMKKWHKAGQQQLIHLVDVVKLFIQEII